MKVMVAVMDKLRLWGSTSICLLMLCLAANVDSGEINVPYGGSISGFGPDYYRGQTFIALPGVANDLTIYVGDSNPLPGPVTYHVLITEVDTTSGIHPTNVLFESGPLVTNIGYDDPPEISIYLGGLSLTVGEKYAWILDAYVELDANPPVKPGGPHPSALVGTNYYFGDDFPEIEQLSLHLGLYPTGTREEHFNKPWSTNTRDLAFTMNFPEKVIPPAGCEQEDLQGTWMTYGITGDVLNKAMPETVRCKIKVISSGSIALSSCRFRSSSGVDRLQIDGGNMDVSSKCVITGELLVCSDSNCVSLVVEHGTLSTGKDVFSILGRFKPDPDLVFSLTGHKR